MTWLGFAIPVVVIWFCAVSFLGYYAYEFITEKNIEGALFMGALIVFASAIDWMCVFMIYLNNI
jgi:uncharacterized membrane protein